MSEKQRTHEPSFYRSLIREQKSKKGRHPRILLKEARTIKDPYYASVALLRLSDDTRMPLADATVIADEAIRLAGQEPRLWRRAELYSMLAKHAKTWNKQRSTEASDQVLNTILACVQAFPKGKELSELINEISSHIGCTRIHSLLDISLQNAEFMLTDGKTVIRQWARTCHRKIPPEGLYMTLSTVTNPFFQSKLMGYLYLQCTKNQINYKKAFQTAIKNALQAQPDEQQKALRYLARHLHQKQDFVELKTLIESVPNPLHRVQLLTTLAGQADKKGLNTCSYETFTDSLHQSELIQDSGAKMKEQIKIAKGFIKINHKNTATPILAQTYQATTNESIKKSIEKTLLKYDLKIDTIHPEINTTKETPQFHHLPHSSGIALGLYDTYEGSIKPIHIRTLARAAPLCAAFGLDIALLNFPLSNIDDFIQQVVADTSIGQGGTYLQYLYEQNRIYLYDDHIAQTYNHDDCLIATTSHPNEKKSIQLQDIFQQKSITDKKRIIVIMGLGKKGLPSSLFKKVPYHLELTGVQIPLETCTAMAIIAMSINYEKKR